MKHSAGILLHRTRDGVAEVLLVHPGGPFWRNKDEHAWSMPKGEFGADEDPQAAARREFAEETGFAPDGALRPLGVFRASGKAIHAFALAGDRDPARLVSNEFEMEWPPRSGKTARFPEADRAAWFDLETARTKIHKGQVALIDALAEMLAGQCRADDRDR